MHPVLKLAIGVVSVIALVATLIIVLDPAVSAPAGAEEVCDLSDNDGDGLVDEGFVVTCSHDADCGPSGFYGEPFCEGGDVWRPYYGNRCAGGIGTCASTCVSEQTERLLQECPDGCGAGACL